jgi:hypothetical protein
MDVTREINPQMSQHSTAESEAFELKVPGTSPACQPAVLRLKINTA